MAMDPNARYHLPQADYERYGVAQAMWMEARMNVIMDALENQPDIAEAMKNYIVFITHSKQVPHEKYKQALKTKEFAEATLVNLATCIALEEFQDGQDDLYTPDELRARIKEDLAIEMLLVADDEKASGRSGRG